MRVSCDQGVLEQGVHLVQRAVSTRTTMPILSYLLFEALDQSLEIAATDLEIGMRTRIPARVERPGSIALPARLLSEIVSNLPPAPVELEVPEGEVNARIRCGRSGFEILGLPASEFPSTPQEPEGSSWSVPAPLLRTLIRSTLFAASTDETRPFLTGVYVVITGREIRAVATDGGRLALRRAQLTSGAGEMSAIVPAKAMRELDRALGGLEEEVQIGLGPAQMVVTLPHLRLTSRLISGTFPAYEQVIPKEWRLRVRVGTEALRGAVRRVAITARDSASVVRFRVSDGILRLESNTPEVGSAYEELEVAQEGEPLEVAFNARYLLDALAVMETGEVVLELTGPLSPGALRPVGSEEYVYVVAPVRVYG
ncbi:MAG: DNA polymerase III subunit beta [Armatimonadota bacterium]|nr:DNA polymerase III subunit beta [Armatimonadota bacterium]MDR7444055.1 DNA polymerase III subunit beta [Armatimonadota bacterium]MDR7570266.1 DNA polymerase III subunit beta [Armatimonadota bacterium]MDR7613504.1 DNA polymerase III subunit beta [Armatimonadota bacterium]